MAIPPSRRLHWGWRARLGLLLAAGLLALAAGEVALRALGVSYPNFYRWDEKTGTALRPGASGWWFKENRVYVLINRAGLRDRDHDLRKPSGTFRIAVLGDSYAEAFQVKLEDAFFSVLERELSACRRLAGKTIEAVNFGVSGHGTAQQLLMFRHRARDYQPDLVVLAFVTGNDIRNNSRELEGDPMRPYFTEQDGELILDDAFRRTGAFRRRQTSWARAYYQAVARSRLLQFGQIVKRRLLPPPGAPPILKEESPGGELGLDDAIYLTPPDERWEKAWRVTELLIRSLGREAEAQGAAFLLVLLTNGIQVHPDPALRETFRLRIGAEGLDLPNRRLASFAARHGISYLDLVPAFRAEAERTGAFLHGFGADLGGGHWNERGHALAGHLIAEEICRGLEDDDPGGF